MSGTGGGMAELRKVRFGRDFWNVVDDDHDNKQIIGSLMFLDVSAAVLKWRAEFAPLWGAPEDLAVGYFQTEMEAMDFLERHTKGEPDG